MHADLLICAAWQIQNTAELLPWFKCAGLVKRVLSGGRELLGAILDQKEVLLVCRC